MSNAETVKYALEALNGDSFTGSQEGENLVSSASNIYVLDEKLATYYATESCGKTGLDSDQVYHTLLENLSALIRQGEKGSDAVLLATLRACAVKHGLVSPNFKPEAFYVKYSETRYGRESETALEAAKQLVDAHGEVIAMVTKWFTDIVCCVAYVFRARGHHFVEKGKYLEYYTKLWAKLRHDESGIQLPWAKIATVGLHAVFPSILDDFWLEASSEQRCSGALVKRINVAPAGSAGPYVLKQGLNDLLIIAPGIKSALAGCIASLERHLELLSAHRFEGSVNARYYGAKRCAMNESTVGALAATIYAAVNQLVEDSPLKSSAALKRIADQAPITGAVLARSMKAIATDSRTVDSLMSAPKTGKG